MNSDQLKAEAAKALNCLYIAVSEEIADDVNTKVRAYINALAVEITEIKQALDTAGTSIGNEHETYSLAKRIELLAGQKDYFVKQTDKARAEAEARTPKVSHGIQINNARAIAYHIRQGEPFAGLNMEALAAWVDAVADEMEALDNLWKKP